MEISRKFIDWKSGKYKMDLNSSARFGERITEKLLKKDGWRVEQFRRLLYRKKKCSKIEMLVSKCQEQGRCWWEEHGSKKKCPDFPNIKYMLSQYIWDLCQEPLSRFCFEVCKNPCINRKALKIMQEVRDKYNESPGLDFVAYKDKEIYAVEVKTGQHSELKVEQKEFTERLRQELAIGLLVVHIIINDELTYSAKLRQTPSKLG
jgi:hypothetical protein